MQDVYKRQLQEHLAKLDDSIQIMFKLSIPDADGFYSDIMEDTHVAVSYTHLIGQDCISCLSLR